MSFKTFLLIYIAVCASMGKDIAGYRCKNKGPVVYVAAEDAKGVEKRLVGYRLAHNIPQSDVHIAIIKAAPNLGTVKGDAIPLAKAIDEQLAAKGYDNPSAIVVDTLNQTLGVWSRNEVVRIDFEDCGNFRPGLADDLIRRTPFEGLQVLGEVVGGDEGQDGPSGCADRRSGRP